MEFNFHNSYRWFFFGAADFLCELLFTRIFANENFFFFRQDQKNVLAWDSGAAGWFVGLEKKLPHYERVNVAFQLRRVKENLKWIESTNNRRLVFRLISSTSSTFIMQITILSHSLVITCEERFNWTDFSFRRFLLACIILNYHNSTIAISGSTTRDLRKWFRCTRPTLCVPSQNPFPASLPSRAGRKICHSWQPVERMKQTVTLRAKCTQKQ